MSGKLFVIEGLDGSGKQTQSDLLYERLKREGHNIIKVSYPNYKSESSALAKMYLRGDFGLNPEDISPYISSTFFAADRYASFKTEYEEFYNSGGIVIADRYTTSNMVHQASKIHDKNKRSVFLDWLWNFEFEIYKIPIPTKVFFLDIPSETAIALIEKRANKFSHEDKKDIHEINAIHLSDSYINAVELAVRYDWERIGCTDNCGLKSIEDIHQTIYNKLIQYL